MRKIHVNFMKDLRNHEFEGLYCNIIDFVDKQQLEDESINTAFENVKAHKKRLFNMRRRSSSKFTIENKKLTHLRNNYLRSLRLRVQSFLLTNNTSEREAANVIQLILNSYGREFYVPTITTQSRFADNLKNHLKESKNFREAISLLHLRDLLDDIIELTVEIKKNHSNRIDESYEAKTKRKGVKQEAYHDMRIMADTINVAMLINRHNKEKKAIIEDLIYDINSILQDFHTPLKSRITKRRNKQAIEAAVEELTKAQKEQPKLLSEGVSNGDVLLDLRGVPSTGSERNISVDSITLHRLAKKHPS